MTKKTKQTAWIVLIVVIAVGGLAGSQAYTQISKIRHKGIETCLAHFETTTDKEINEDELTLTHLETVFPEPFDKRFRANCTYDGVTVLMESKPFKEWRIIDATEID